MDKLISSFVKTNINKLNINELEDLEDFLDIDDDTLYKLYTKQPYKTKIKITKITILFKSFKY